MGEMRSDIWRTRAKCMLCLEFLSFRLTTHPQEILFRKCPATLYISLEHRPDTSLFVIASLRLWNQLPDYFRQLRQSCLDSLPHSFVSSSLSSSPLSSCITPSLFHSMLKTVLPFQQILPTLDFFYLPDCLHDNGTGPDLSRSSFYFQFHILIFLVCSVWWTKLAGCPSAFYCTSNTHYRIVGKDYIGRIIKYTLCPKKTVVPNFGDNFVKS